jgi:hypothetical protein
LQLSPFFADPWHYADVISALWLLKSEGRRPALWVRARPHAPATIFDKNEVTADHLLAAGCDSNEPAICNPAPDPGRQ